MTEAEIKAVLTQKGTVAVFAETPDYLVLLKSAGIPSAPLKGGLRSAYELAADMFPEICSVTGKSASEGGLIHRIDNDTAGLLLIARTQQFYNLAQDAQKAGGFVKTYTAYCAPQALHDTEICSGASAFLCGKTNGRKHAFTASDLPYTIESRFRPLGEKGAMVKPVYEDEATRADLKKAGSTVYRTSVFSLDVFMLNGLNKDASFPVKKNIKAENVLNDLSASKNTCRQLIRACCSITAGFRHQVRAHLASSGYPVYGDKLYGVPGNWETEKTQMLFFASGLEISELGLSLSLPDIVLDEIASDALH